MQEITVKDSLLQNAMNLMMHEGYERVSIDDVANKANVSKGAVYYYFPSKIELGVETLKHYFDTLRSHMTFGNSVNPTDRIASYLDSVASIYKENKMESNVCLIGLFALSSEKDDKIKEKTQEYFNAWIRALQPICEQAIANSNLKLSGYDLARQIVTTIEGALVMHAADSDNAKLVKTVECYKITILRALGV